MLWLLKIIVTLCLMRLIHRKLKAQMGQSEYVFWSPKLSMPFLVDLLDGHLTPFRSHFRTYSTRVSLYKTAFVRLYNHVLSGFWTWILKWAIANLTCSNNMLSEQIIVNIHYRQRLIKPLAFKASAFIYLYASHPDMFSRLLEEPIHTENTDFVKWFVLDLELRKRVT